MPVSAGRGAAGRRLPDRSAVVPEDDGVWSEKVTDVKVNAFGVLDFVAIKVK